MIRLQWKDEADPSMFEEQSSGHCIDNSAAGNHSQDAIQKLLLAALRFFIEGLTSGTISEGQVAALGMAIFFNGMRRDEAVALTWRCAISATCSMTGSPARSSTSIRPAASATMSP